MTWDAIIRLALILPAMVLGLYLLRERLRDRRHAADDAVVQLAAQDEASLLALRERLLLEGAGRSAKADSRRRVAVIDRALALKTSTTPEALAALGQDKPAAKAG